MRRAPCLHKAGHKAGKPLATGLSIDFDAIDLQDFPPMTAHAPSLSAAGDFSGVIDPVKLDRLAEVAIKVGLQLQPGQDLVLTS
jgi:hypothetical protein